MASVDKVVYAAAEELIRRFMKHPKKEDIQEFAEELQERLEDIAKLEEDEE